MIRHIVLWKLAERDRDETARTAAAMFEALRGEIDGLLTLEVSSDALFADSTCDLVLYTEFVDESALAAYQSHPAHERVKAFLGPRRVDRQVADFPSEGCAGRAGAR